MNTLPSFVVLCGSVIVAAFLFWSLVLLENWVRRVSFSFCMSLVLSLLMTGWVTYLNLGITEFFVQNWTKAFLLAWPAAFLIALFCSELVGKLSTKLSDVVLALIR